MSGINYLLKSQLALEETCFPALCLMEMTTQIFFTSYMSVGHDKLEAHYSTLPDAHSCIEIKHL